MNQSADALGSSRTVTAPPAVTKRLNFFERYVSLWVALCMVAGIILGKAFPTFMNGLRGLEFGGGSHINIPIAVLIWLMITPMMMKVDFGAIRDIGRRPRGIGSIGIVPDHGFEAFEARLDAIEATGVFVERLQPEEIDDVSTARPVFREFKKLNPRALPVVLVNDEIICAGRYPTSTEWAHALGACRRAEQPASTR